MDQKRRELAKVGGGKRSMGFATIELKHLSIFEKKKTHIESKAD